MIDFAKSGKSFGFALRGVRALIRAENNARIHLVLTIFAVILGFGLSISPVEWAILVLAIALVWAAEAVNTAVERLVDLVSPNYEARAGEVKDLAAAAVLVAAAAAFVVGLVLFLPKLLARFV